ncbi:pectin lyase fold/virulence factor [Vibrio phage 1.121.O._10N.286.46.C4]|nr:pectin lyase fold/virulence factor [Vibrio phage 1.121.O._10N.286.46.C4]
MAKIPQLQSTTTLGLEDETIVRQGTVDKRVRLQLAATLAWARRNGFNHLGAHSSGVTFTSHIDFTTFGGRAYFLNKSTAVDHVSNVTDPRTDDELYHRVDVATHDLEDRIAYKWGLSSNGDSTSVANEVYLYQPTDAQGDKTGATIEVYDPVGGNEMGVNPDYSVFNPVSGFIDVTPLFSDNTQNIQAAVDAAESSYTTRGIAIPVRLKAGSYNLVTPSTKGMTWPVKLSGGTTGTISSDKCYIVLPDNVTVIFDDGAVLLPNSDSVSAVFVSNGNNTRIEKFHCVGTSPSTGNCHGIFQLATDLDNEIFNLRIIRPIIRNVSSYGIGLQYGKHRSCVIDSPYIRDTGADCIDIKSRRETGDLYNDTDISCAVISPDLVGAGNRLVGSVGLDIRGSWNVSNVSVILNQNDTSGVRLRPADETLPDARNVAFMANVVNVAVEAISPSLTGTIGLVSQGVNCNISNVSSDACEIGVASQGSGSGEDTSFTNFSNINVTRHKIAGWDSTPTSKNTTVTNFSASNATSLTANHINVEGTGNTFIGLTYDDSVTVAKNIAGVARDSTVIMGEVATSESPQVSLEAVTPSLTQVRAVGGGTDVDMAITPKGTGKIRYGTYQAGSVTATGYIEIKDASGAIRKLIVA